MKNAIEAVLSTQARAWNEGHIDVFMEHYWNSEQLTFSSGGKTTRGWQQTLEGYKKRYPSKEKMGRLSFSQLEISELGENAALVLGRWQLERKKDRPGGNFSLVLRRFNGRWLIAHDHTSLSKEPEKNSETKKQ
jgi:ketosteroid isomerase-like protein